MNPVEQYFNSETFISHVRRVCGRKINPMSVRRVTGCLVAAALRWYQMFNHTLHAQDLIEYMTPIVDEMTQNSLGFSLGFERNATIIDGLKNASSKILDPTSPDYDDQFKRLVIGKATKFHGFNRAFEDSIWAHGINPGAKFGRQNDLDQIEKILQKIGKTLGFSHTDKGQVCYSTSPSVTYNYALGSPEWFKFFCGQEAYLNRDYNTAKQNVTTMINQPQISPNETKQVMEFFERYWSMFAVGQQAQPMVVMTPYYDTKNGVEKAMKQFENFDTVMHSPAYTMLNEKTDQVISTAKAEFIALPEFERVYEKIQLSEKLTTPQETGISR